MLFGELFNNIRKLIRNVLFFAGVFCEVEQLPGLRLPITVESPILRADCNKMTSWRIGWIVVQPEEMLVNIARLFAEKIGHQIDTIDMFWGRGFRGGSDGGVEVECAGKSIEAFALRNNARPGDNRRAKRPADLLRILSLFRPGTESNCLPLRRSPRYRWTR